MPVQLHPLTSQSPEDIACWHEILVASLAHDRPDVAAPALAETTAG